MVLAVYKLGVKRDAAKFNINEKQDLDMTQILSEKVKRLLKIKQRLPVTEWRALRKKSNKISVVFRNEVTVYNFFTVNIRSPLCVQL